MNVYTRRHFLKHTSLPVASTMLNLQLAGTLGAQGTGGQEGKSLVCVHFNGGLDGFHLLVPRDASRHADYAASRSNLHLPLEGSLGQNRNALLPLTESNGGNGSDLYGLHSNTPELADMFNGTGNFQDKPCLSFVGNVGTLVKPLTLDQLFTAKPGIDLPVGLGGHFRQTEQWHTAIPQGTVDLRGWLGRTADEIHPNFNDPDASMNLSVSGNNLMQFGVDTRPFAYSGLSRGLSGNTAPDESLLSLKNLFHRRMLGLEHENLVDRTFAETSTLSLDQQVAVREAVENFDDDQLIERFPIDSTAQSFRNVIAMIAVREQLGLRRQTFFLEMPGWDDHAELPNSFAERITAVSENIARFQRNLNALGLADSVIGFTSSEFSRTLRSTGAGSDHAWGGPQMIFGGRIKGGRVLGRYPSLALGGPDDVGRGGRLLPFHSCDEYFADMLRWFGVNNDQLKVVLPNIENFSGRDSIGYLNT